MGGVVGADIDYEFVERIQRLVDEDDFLAKTEENDRLARYPAESVSALKGLGVPGMSVHPQFGGLGHNVMVEDPDVVWTWFSYVASLI